MAVERGYESQVGPAAPTPAPRADPNAFGASVGAGLEAVGDALHRLDTDSQAADFNARFAQLREAADNQSIDARKNAAAGAAGHAQQMKDWWEAQSAGMLDGIKDRRLQRSAQAQLAEFGARLNSSEYQWQLGQQAGKIVADQAKAADLAANRAYRFTDPATLGEEFKFARSSIMDLQGASADVKDRLIHEHEAAAAGGFFNGVIDRGKPRDALALLDTGAYDSILTKEQMQHLRNKAGVEINRLDAANKAQAAIQLHLEKESLATRRAELDTGAGAPQDWDALAARYDAIGDTSSAVTARAKGASMAATIGYRGDTLPQLDAQIASLQAVRHNGAGLTPQEASKLSGLTDLRGQLAGMLGQPGGAMLALQFATGKPVAPINPSDPTSMHARAAYAKAAAAQYGRPVADPLLPTELPTFKDLVTGGAQQKLQALQMIQGFGDPQVIRAAGAQIAGDDGAFRIASQLPLSVARSVLLGADTLKTSPQLLKPKAGQRDAHADFSLWFNRSNMLNYVSSTYSNDVFEAAKLFYVNRAATMGLDHYDSGRFAEAVRTVLGQMTDANGSTGGIAEHDRGQVLVPQGTSPKALLNRFRFASADDYARASGGNVPHWSDGTPLTRTELIKVLPTAIGDPGDGHYGFRGPGDNKLIAGRDGRPYIVDIRRLAK